MFCRSLPNCNHRLKYNYGKPHFGPLAPPNLHSHNTLDSQKRKHVNHHKLRNNSGMFCFYSCFLLCFLGYFYPSTYQHIQIGLLTCFKWSLSPSSFSAMGTDRQSLSFDAVGIQSGCLRHLGNFSKVLLHSDLQMLRELL